MSARAGCLLAHTENASSPHKPRRSNVHIASQKASQQLPNATRRAHLSAITPAMIAPGSARLRAANAPHPRRAEGQMLEFAQRREPFAVCVAVTSP